MALIGLTTLLLHGSVALAAEAAGSSATPPVETKAPEAHALPARGPEANAPGTVAPDTKALSIQASGTQAPLASETPEAKGSESGRSETTRSRTRGASAAPVALTLASFKVVSERNIFNTNRRPRSGPPLKKPVKIESFSLRGTLQDEAANTAYAFFGGSESRYNAVCKLGETIAGYKVLEIQPDSVKLETNEMRIDLPIGMQMRRQDEGAWQVIVGVAASSAGESHSPPSPSSDRFSRGDRGPGAQPSDRYARNDRSYGSQPSDRFSRGDRGFGGPPSDRFSRGDRSQGSDGGRSGRRGRISTTAGETEFQAEVLDGVATVAAASSASSPSSATSASSSGSSDTAGLSADEILKRLMQKREQEMNR